ncbi:MAG: hypothetical protein ABW128_00485, partial [Rhizorhabdus sp.]
MIGGLLPRDGAAMRIDAIGGPVDYRSPDGAVTDGTTRLVEQAAQRNAIVRLLAAALDNVPRPEPWLDARLDWDALIPIAAGG